MRLDTGMISTQPTGTTRGFSVATLISHAYPSIVAGMIFAVIVSSPLPAFAQLLSPIVPTINLRYTFSVPVVKPVVNPCSTTFVLINGRTDLTIDTSAGTDFKMFVDY